MEKHSRYRDQATGIAPFLPNKSSRKPVLEMALQYALGTLLYPIVLVVLAISAAVHAVSSVPALAGIFTLWIKVLVRVFLRVFYVDLSYEGERKASVRKSDIQRAKPGDMIISNFVSPLDPLVYSSFFPSQFVFPNQGKFIPTTLWGACTQALSLSLAPGASEGIEGILERAKTQGKVVVLFGEGTTSNGKGVLSLQHVNWNELAPLAGRVFMSALKYTANTVTTPVGGGVLAYLYKMQTQSLWYMVSVQISKPVPPASRTKLGASSVLSSVGRTRLIGDDLGIDAKREFFKLSR